MGREILLMNALVRLKGGKRLLANSYLEVVLYWIRPLVHWIQYYLLRLAAALPGSQVGSFNITYCLLFLAGDAMNWTWNILHATDPQLLPSVKSKYIGPGVVVILAQNLPFVLVFSLQQILNEGPIQQCDQLPAAWSQVFQFSAYMLDVLEICELVLFYLHLNKFSLILRPFKEKKYMFGCGHP